LAFRPLLFVSSLYPYSRGAHSIIEQAAYLNGYRCKALSNCALVPFFSGIGAPKIESLMSKKDEHYSDEETARRYEATLKRVLSTPPKLRTAKGEKANPPKKRGRPQKDKLE
jgi:hypothetical protein